MIARTKAEAREAVARLRDGRVALVPTMGYLHEGHASLIDRARGLAEHVVLSIYVNPLQFGTGEDFDVYPRDFDRDAALARRHGVDLIFAPTDREMYPAGPPAVRIEPGRLADTLCGAYRPGHFQGVLTVVAKLFHIVGPDVAVFGQKDFQQAVLIRRMVEDLDLPIEIDVAPIVREPDGLAMSSRNVHLSAESRARALGLGSGLAKAADAFRDGERRPDRLRALVREHIGEGPGVRVQYVELVDPATLEPVVAAEAGCVLAVAAYFGGTRLIDNMILG